MYEASLSLLHVYSLYFKTSMSIAIVITILETENMRPRELIAQS